MKIIFIVFSYFNIFVVRNVTFKVSVILNLNKPAAKIQCINKDFQFIKINALEQKQLSLNNTKSQNKNTNFTKHKFHTWIPSSFREHVACLKLSLRSRVLFSELEITQKTQDILNRRDKHYRDFTIYQKQFLH